MFNVVNCSTSCKHHILISVFKTILFILAAFVKTPKTNQQNDKSNACKLRHFNTLTHTHTDTHTYPDH